MTEAGGDDVKGDARANAVWGDDPDQAYAALSRPLAPWVYMNVREASEGGAL